MKLISDYSRILIVYMSILLILIMPHFCYGSNSAKIEVFVRHCHFSAVSQHKNRPVWFSREVCHKNLMNTLDPDLVNVTFVLDTFHPMKNGEHFVKKQDKYKVIEIREGAEAKAFLWLIDYISSLNLDPETIVYIVEDDYLHRPQWAQVLLEGFSIPSVSYITLYDHQDKYYSSIYESLQSKLYHTKSCHWRVTPSTTNTYAMKFKTLQRDLPIHRGYSLNIDVTADHAKFCALNSEGKFLISPIPGWSTHLEPEFFSPCIDWESIHNAYK